MTPRDRAQQGKKAILEAILEVLGREGAGAVGHRALVAELGLESEYQGGQRNYVTASLLDELMREGKVEKLQTRRGGPMSYRIRA